MSKFILCLDIDDCILPSSHTYLGRFDDSHEILKLNMKRISAMLKKYDMQVFITSSWYSVLNIQEDGTLGYEREDRVNDDSHYLVDEYMNFKAIRDGLGKRVIGLSCGDRYKDISKLLNEGHRVVSLDDMDLTPDYIIKHGGEVCPTKLEENYLFLETKGFVTNEHGYKMHNFVKKENQ